MTRRMLALLAVAAVLGIYRLMAPKAQMQEVEVAEYVMPSHPAVETAQVAPSKAEAQSAASALESEVLLGNPFASRYPPPAVLSTPVKSATPPPRLVALEPASAPVQPPVARVEPQPFQVLGVIADGQGLGVFLVGPKGILLARQGSEVSPDVSVAELSRQNLVLVNRATNQRIPISLPRLP